MKVIFILTMIVFLTSCTFISQDIRITCRHKVLSMAVAAQEHYLVRIAIGRWKDENHVQPQIYINNRWIFIGKTRNNNRLKIISIDDFEVIGYMTLEEYFKILLENNQSYKTK